MQLQNTVCEAVNFDIYNCRMLNKLLALDVTCGYITGSDKYTCLCSFFSIFMCVVLGFLLFACEVLLCRWFVN